LPDQPEEPLGELIHRLFETAGPIEPHDMETLTQALANAPFSAKLFPIEPAWRGLLPGEIVGGQADSLTYHVLKRIHERQWASGTTRAEYLRDAHAAFQAPKARIAIWERWRQLTAGVVAPVEHVVPAVRRGERSRDYVAVYYAVRNGTLSSAVMIEKPSDLSSQWSIRWLE